jgi:hypothetical protein
LTICPRYSISELVAEGSAMVDELVGRLGVDEVCRQLGVASIDELYRLLDPADADAIDPRWSTKRELDLEQCGNCGRYGWHATERCPD